MAKPKVSFYDLTQPAGIVKLRGDGVSREEISKSMYAHTDGASLRERKEIMRKLHDKSCATHHNIKEI